MKKLSSVKYYCNISKLSALEKNGNYLAALDHYQQTLFVGTLVRSSTEHSFEFRLLKDL